MSNAPENFRLAVLACLGHAPEVIEPDRLHRFATCERRSDTAGWCKLFADLRGGVFGCHRQGISETWSAQDRRTMTTADRIALAAQLMAAAAQRETVQREVWAGNAQRITRLLSESKPLTAGDPVTLYLKRRGFGGVWPLPDALRLHRALPYWDGDNKLGTYPAMVAPVTAIDGRVVALHRTYLCADGRKAPVPEVKKLTGTAGPLTGASIALHKPARGVMGIAEGIETALAGWCMSGVPTVAAYCAGNLASWRWPPGVQRLVIFADHDKVGREAADTLRARAFTARLRCEVLTPTATGTDWCDVWSARDGVAIEGLSA